MKFALILICSAIAVAASLNLAHGDDTLYQPLNVNEPLGPMQMPDRTSITLHSALTPVNEDPLTDWRRIIALQMNANTVFTVRLGVGSHGCQMGRRTKGLFWRKKQTLSC